MTAATATAARRRRGPSPLTLLMWRRFVKHRLAVASAAILVILGVLTAAAPLIAWAMGIEQWDTDLMARLQGPSAAHPLGTILLAFIILKERPARLQWAGMAVTVAGVVALSAVAGV